MKKIALTALIALGVGLPSLAAADDSFDIHNDTAKRIFEQLANESRGDKS
jgi:hypothetical protein